MHVTKSAPARDAYGDAQRAALLRLVQVLADIARTSTASREAHQEGSIGG